ncbi:unnamed protein product, partial [Cladocopium goreaui]
PDSFQKLPRLSQDGSSIWSCRGSGAAWQRKTLHLRGDLRSDLVPLDRFATARIGGSWAPECEVVRLHQSSADALGMTAQAPFSCLRLADQLPQGVVTVELKPGNGLLELYGQPGLYHMQDESLLRSAEMAKGGSYSAVDIFSGRRERVLRALEALNAQGKCGDAELQVLVDERPATMAEAAELLQVTGATASAPTAAPAAAPVLAIIAQLLDGRSGQEAFSGLLPCLLRAQCAAGPALHSSCSQLNETLKSKDGAWKVSVEDMENAMKRGYWSLPPDQSGLHLREREAERLLDRAKRELWQEGSASRLELEKQIRRFLCLNLLGDAACHARLRFSFARPKTPLEQESLAELHFLQLQTAPEIWCRLELAPLQLKSL